MQCSTRRLCPRASPAPLPTCPPLRGGSRRCATQRPSSFCIAQLQESDLPGCIVFLDWEKAYDRVVRGWLFAVLRRMGFPQLAVSWVRLMLAGTTARVSLMASASERGRGSTGSDDIK